MKLIVGLGNPGRQYERTPHNVGFEVVDILAKRHSGTWSLERRFEAMTADVRIGGNRVTLMKPLTFMNLSGRAVTAYTGKNGGEPGEILAITDDINLHLGTLRLRPGGSHGGHKGLLSMINCLGKLDFPRLRVGVKPNGARMDDWVNFVLSQLLPKEREVLVQSEEDAADCIEMIEEKDFASAMNLFNRKKPAAE